MTNADLTYYKEYGFPATRDEMFTYADNLLKQGNHGEARKVLVDLMTIEKVENTNVPADLYRGYQDATDEAKLKALMKNNQSWYVNDSTPSKEPTKEAITALKELNLPSRVLKDYMENQGIHLYYEMDLLSHAEAWSKEDIIEFAESDNQIKAQFAYKIVQKSTDMAVVRELIEKKKNLESPFGAFSIGDGSNLDEETLGYALQHNYFEVARDPRVTTEMLLDKWEALKSDGLDLSQRLNLKFMFLKNAVNNPNTPSELLDASLDHGGSVVLSLKVIYHPNMTASLLDKLLPILSTNDLKVAYAKHPLATLKGLKRLAKSAVPAIRNAAMEGIAKQSEKQNERRRNRF